MGKIEVTHSPIVGLEIIKPTVFADSRGYFFESFNAKDFAAAGINYPFVQDNQSKSSYGVVRGLHYQRTHPQGKLVRVILGEVFDVAVDIRKDSPTFGKWYGVTLSAENYLQFFIPPGFAHGFATLSESAIFSYKCTDYYDPSDEAGIAWNDQSIGIEWPIKQADVILSAKDQRWPNLSQTFTANS